MTTVEELVRTLPQNVATIGAITNNRSRGPLYPNTGNSGTRVVSDVGALGVSAANLGGLGAGNTLVLVNGRRIAGAAGFEQGFVNLNGIPLSAIERVEISTGGQSAIYGADAMGGVINFILKRNYVGTTISASHRRTSAGSDDTRISLYTGRAWGSGNFAATLEFGRTNPIVNAKTGYVTNNYASVYNGNAMFDRRSFNTGTQPGTAVQPAVYDPRTGQLLSPQVGLTVPVGFVGAPNDRTSSRPRRPARATMCPNLRVPRRARSARRSISNRRSPIGCASSAPACIPGRASRSSTGRSAGSASIWCRANMYNPFPAFTFGSFAYSSPVCYFPGAEIADGTLVPGDVRATSKAWTVNGGVSYDFGRAAKVQLIYTKSKTGTEGSGTQVGSIAGFSKDAKSPTGYSCYNFQLANNRIPLNQRDAFQAAFQRQCAAISSSDPNIAFNPWKSTSNGGGAGIDTFLYPYVVDDLGSSLDNVEGRLTGEAAVLPGGAISYALGAEYARSGLKNTIVSNFAGPDPSSSRYAFFGEMNLPILGKDYTLPFAKRLLFNIALRRDVNSSTGAIGTVNNVPVDSGGQIIYGKNRFGSTTPSWGVLWSPSNTIDVRAKFTRGFKAPPPTQLYSVQGSQQFLSSVTGDPLYTCTTDCSRITNGVRTYNVPTTLAPNPNLRPETSRQQIYSVSWQPTGPLSGLNVAVTYNRNRIRNQFATTKELFFYIPALDILKIPLFYPRDPVTNKVIAYNNARYNIVGSRYESIAYEASYLFYTGIGSFQPKITYIDNIVAETTGLTEAQKIDQRGRILGIDKYKMVGSLQWNWNKVSTNLYVYHTPSYLNDYYSFYAAGVQQNPELIRRVKPLTTVDLSVSWVVSKQLNVQLAGRNIFKTAAPFTVVDSLPYDTARYNVEGRSLMLSARLSM
ncbi:TonB-dependent receptor [Sphingomonas sp. WKB10]|nr:TonB-dependent receptor [Sphingomonas sp. WKB10]